MSANMLQQMDSVSCLSTAILLDQPAHRQKNTSPYLHPTPLSRHGPFGVLEQFCSENQLALLAYQLSTHYTFR